MRDKARVIRVSLLLGAIYFSANVSAEPLEPGTADLTETTHKEVSKKKDKGPVTIIPGTSTQRVISVAPAAPAPNPLPALPPRPGPVTTAPPVSASVIQDKGQEQPAAVHEALPPPTRTGVNAALAEMATTVPPEVMLAITNPAAVNAMTNNTAETKASGEGTDRSVQDRRINTAAIMDKTQTHVSTLGLPGLGRPPGQPAPGKPIVIQAQSGVNEMAHVSISMPNRIATPFARPRAIDFSNTEIKALGSSIYIIPKNNKPIGLFITDDTPNSPTISLTLVPRDIPGQTILINIDGGYQPDNVQDKDEHPSDYEDGLRQTMRRLARDRAPQWTTETKLDVGAAVIGDLHILPEKQFSGQSLDAYRYRITNSGKEAVELTEESFYQPGVKAVAFFPNVRLDPKESTRVFILMGKKEGED